MAKRGGGGREAEEESRESATTELNRPTDSSARRLLLRIVGPASRALTAPTTRGRVCDERERTK